MQIKKNMKIADVILLNSMLIPVIHRFGITLGFGDKTVEEVCRDNEVELKFFLELVNAYHDKDYFPKEELQAIPVKDIVGYLKTTHTGYLDNSLLEIESMIDILRSEKDEDQKYIGLIKNFFEDYRTEVIEHIRHEEDVVFPYVLAVEQIIKEQEVSEVNREVFESYSMEAFQKEHDDIEEKLLDMKTILIKYLTPPVNTAIYHKIIQELFRLEEDISYHARIEDKVLVPKVEVMERAVKKML